jgi:hypothetical protein
MKGLLLVASLGAMEFTQEEIPDTPKPSMKS